MTSSAYDYHADYYAINTGAHRKGGLELDTPTLTHHLGLWFPRNHKLLGAKRSVEVHGQLVDAYVAAHYEAMRGLAGFERNFEFDVDGIDVICLFGGAYVAENATALQPFEISSQPRHFALKDAVASDNRILFMKARLRGLVVIVRCEFHSEYFALTRTVTVADLGDMPPDVGELAAALTTLVDTAAEDRPMTVERCHAYLYRDIWERLDTCLFACADLFGASAAADRCRIFADFRGLVLTGHDGPTGGLSLDDFRLVPDAGQPFDAHWPRRTLLPSLWRFLTVEKGLDLKRREFTASFMLRQRAVYVTALGPQPPAVDPFACAPLNYLLVARPISDWQLGTLVDRLHFMGTVRLAALMELEALRIAGANLRAMEHEAEDARAALEADAIDAALRHYQRAQDLISHTDADRRPIFWEGLQFRVERSRYYVKRFEDFVPFLAMSAIEGFQQYDHFVKARLGGNYDYIHRLGQRQERAVRSVAGLWQAISLKEGATLGRQSAQIARTIEKLQTKAEIALLAVIVPHYAMDIIHAFQDEAEHGHHTIVRWYAAILIVGIVLALTSLIAYLLDIARRRAFRRLFEIVLKYVALSIVSIGITLAIMRLQIF